MSFAQRITRINGLSDRRRLPRLGKIRGGIKLKSAKSGKEYPKETDYFVCPPEVRSIFGDKPKDLEIMLPINEIDAVFPQSLKWYGSSKGLKCHGDMKIAYRYNDQDRDWHEMECPCEHLEDGSCKQSATLQFIIPKVSVGGVYQLTTSSFNSIVDLNSGIDYVQAMLGRFALVPLTLRRVATETHHDNKRQIHYTYQIIFDVDLNTLNALRADTQRVLEHPRYQLPPPAVENPEYDPVDGVVDEEDQVPEAEVVEQGTLGKGLDTALIMLKGYQEKDMEAFLVGKRNAKVTVKLDSPNLTLDKANEWLREIEAFVATRE